MTDPTTEANTYRKIPSLDALLADAAVRPLIDRFGREAVAASARDTLDDIRAAIASASPDHSGDNDRSPVSEPDISTPAIADRLRARLERKFAFSLAPAVNATGVIMHSGLGRAVLSTAAAEALAAVASGYSTLALDLEAGKRVSRDRHVEGLLRELTGAEAATVVNNNAAATVIVLNTVAARQGGHRLPGPARRDRRLVPPARRHGHERRRARRGRHDQQDPPRATTRPPSPNRPGPSSASTPATTGLSASPKSRRSKNSPPSDAPAASPSSTTSAAGRSSTCARFGFATEPLVQASVRAGADVACFSGDKLIGGPQSGIIVGKSAWIQKVRKNPLARAFRCGKLTLAALESTLKLFLAPDILAERHPIYRMLALTPDELGRRAKELAAALRERLPAAVAVSVEDGASQVGSGAVPVETLPSKVLAVRTSGLSPEVLARRLRLGTPPVFARIHKDAVLFDLRTIQPGEDATIEKAIIEVFA